MSVAQRELVVILDFGGRVGHKVAKQVRQCQVYCELMPYHTPISEILAKNPRGIIFSGGPASVYEKNAPQVDSSIYELGLPVLGIGYGMQLLARQMGGQITRDPGLARNQEDALEVVATGGLLGGMDSKARVWLSHGDRVLAPPPGFDILASTSTSPVAAMANPAKRLLGVLFHPDTTPGGQHLLRHFLFDICGLNGQWTMQTFIDQMVEEVRDQTKGHRVLCALSGGVDSAVAAALVHRAVGDRLVCVFVDHGLLRQGEAQLVQKVFGNQFNMNLVYVDAAERFFNKLKGVTDPEQKRKIIGEEFIRVFEEEAARLGRVDFLVQGTIYSDIVESRSATGSVIKSHHNVGGLPQDMNLALVEPLSQLFKDEVRQAGAELGLPDRVVWQQPFPGPGLAVRILGEVTREKVAVLQAADAILRDEIARAGLERKIWQYFAVLPNLYSVGVRDGQRSYTHTVAIRAVHSSDGMAADWAKIPHEILERISRRIVQEVPEINRVVYDITPKPPATIEWE